MMERSRFMNLLEIVSNALTTQKMRKLKNLHAQASMLLVRLVLLATLTAFMSTTSTASAHNGMK
jgi:hypothetical protein